MAVHTTGRLLTLHTIATNESDNRAAVGVLAEAVQDATGENLSWPYVDQSCIGEKAELAAAKHGIRLKMVKLSAPKRGFVLLPRRWIVKLSLAYERLPKTIVRVRLIGFAVLVLHKTSVLAAIYNSL